MSAIQTLEKPLRLSHLWLMMSIGLSLLCRFHGMAAPPASGDSSHLNAFVRVSPRDPRYFELSDGTSYIPIGLNLIHPQGAPEEEGLAQMERWMKALAEHGGNYIRVWLSSPFWDVEPERAGVSDGGKARRIDRLLDLARQHGVRVKLTLEHFREIDPANVRQRWASKQLHHVSNGGTAADMPDWLANERSRQQFRMKLAWYQRRFGDQPIVFGWELWNEMNAVRGGDYQSWTEAMLPELKRWFPRNLSLQSLGSFDTDRARPAYQWLCKLRDNDAAQVHRYLDLGAALEICHGPVDVLAADAVRELLAMNPDKPILLAESGAVEPRHTGPFKLYEKDTAGIILHDVLFAPFFAGAAGAGQCWHWGEYVDRNNLWSQFRGFADSVQGIDPAAESFQPRRIEDPRLRLYVLEGKRTTLIWGRDKQSTWQTELEQKRPPETLRGLSVSLEGVSPKARKASIYDPWKRVWSEAKIIDGSIRLPEFQRSIIIRLHVGV